MLRRSLVARSLNKGVQNPGPTLHGWGRTIQKRRLEYETVESKYGKKEFNKNWDLAGAVQRSTDYLELRNYFNYPKMIFTWIWNGVPVAWLYVPGGGVLTAFHFGVLEYNQRMMRAAWW